VDRLQQRPGRLPLALRTGFGTGLLVTGASLVGAAVVSVVLLLLSPVGEQVVGSARATVLWTMAGYVPLAVVVGSVVGVTVQRRTLLWVATGRTPTADESRRALRLPVDLALLTGALWAVATVGFGIQAAALTTPNLGLRVAAGVGLGGLATVGVTYLIVVRIARPLVVLALEAHPPSGQLAMGVLPRLLLTWALAIGVPLLGALVLLIDKPDQISRGGVAVLVAVALLVGALSTVLLGRTLGEPLRQMREVVEKVGAGDLDTELVVDDAGEIGLLQSGLNHMLAGLRERDRISDLFGRHVGPAVAQEALRTGVALGGERRHAVALFVDVAGSTALAEQLSPEQLVAQLNRFFTVVVDAVEANGGLVNKFEGDAALCVFGTPVTLDDPETAALAAARRIRDSVRAAGELDVGIGVAAGEVVAGQVGARSRLEYTVIGDAVNVAARLTELAKATPGRVLASEPTVSSATADEQEHWGEYGEHLLRGRTSPTAVRAAH
jgi:adenylate cyclase